MILFLDDDPNRAAIAYQRWPDKKKENTIWCTEAHQAISTLKDYEIEEANLDHDLEGRCFVNSSHSNTGMEVVRWLEKQDNLNKFSKTLFVVHSHNFGAAIQMVKRLQKLNLNVKCIPFGESEVIVL